MINAIVSKGMSQGLTESIERNKNFIEGWGAITYRTEQGDSQAGGGNLTVRVGGKLFFDWKEGAEPKTNQYFYRQYYLTVNRQLK